MIRFTSDYVQGAHPRILEALAEINNTSFPGYGEDALCAKAAQLIRTACQAPDAEVHFVVGGTQANLLAVAAALRPHQGVLAAESGHISAHETGAIEATGHKVLTLPAAEGKLSAQQVREAAQAHMADPIREHLTQPGMVYISNPTEYGTLYSGDELKALSAACREAGLPLYLDGARLGYGLCAAGASFTLPLLAQCCDAFSIGGTKLGALFGEAIVIPSPALARDFRYIMKQRGAMLAKGWLLGRQFITLFEDGLYFEGARHALRLAGILAAGFQRAGIPLFMPPATNQIFPILPNAAIAKLRQKYDFESWEPTGEAHTAVRFCTAWSTREDDVYALLEDISALPAT